MKLKDLVPGTWEGKPMKIGNLYSSSDLASALSKKKVTAQTVYQYSQTGAIVGKRTIYQK